MATKRAGSSKRVAVVGAGCSGLAAIKCCLDEHLVPVCLEKSSDIGGLWNFSPVVTERTSSIYKNLVINTSKEMMMFSDFPPPENYPHFLTHAKVLEYFRLYAQRFDLIRHIKFQSEVRHVTKSSDYNDTGKWNVTYIRRSKAADTNGAILTEVFIETFDGVMICTGHHSVPFFPFIPGLGHFEGTVLHSHSYKDAQPFQGKRVVILGIGNSAVDIACDLAKSAQQVYISSRRGAWIVPRTSFWGLPADSLANSRMVFTLPYRLLDWCVQVLANLKIDHTTYNLKPQHGVLNCHPTISDELPIHLLNGRVLTRPNIRHVGTNYVQFEDHSTCPCDVIILATGYDYSVDFVDEKVLKLDSNNTKLYKYVFPPDLPHPTMAVIGLIQAIGALMPISEMQSRWFARVMIGAVRLPTQQLMEAEIMERKQDMEVLYIKSRRHMLQTFWIDYMDQVAGQIGVRPNLWKIFCSDPELAIKCYMGPCLPAQYRLVGPGTWDGARSFIVGALSRATRPKSVSSSAVKAATQTGFTWHTNDISVNASSFIQSSLDSSDHIHNQPSPLVAKTKTSRRARRRSAWVIMSPEWATFTFYAALVVTCFSAWLLNIMFNQADSLLNVVDSQLPLSD